MWLDQEILKGLLEDCGIDITSWGVGKAKTVNDLFGEIVEGESHLRIDDDGLHRIIEVAKLHISQALYAERGCLVEVSESLPDGRVISRNEYPSETLKKGETSQQAVMRGIWEELQVGKDGIYSVEMTPPVVESRPSKSYPGFSCKYVLHHAKIELYNSVSICHQVTFTVKEDDGTEHVFRWEHFL